MASLCISRVRDRRCYAFMLNSATLLLYGIASSNFSSADWFGGTFAFLSMLLLMSVQES